ncbi:MAG: DUF5658 family protein [Dehalococcoidales bacterium]|jgi:hypothetical protein
MNDTFPIDKQTVQNSRSQRLLLGALFSLSVADGVVTRFIITEGLGMESNFWLTKLAFSDALIAVKIAATLLVVYLLWQMHYRKPKLVMGFTIAMVCWYTLIVFWNIFIVVMGSR